MRVESGGGGWLVLVLMLVLCGDDHGDDGCRP